MKTKEEVKKWIEKQEWFKTYVKNIYIDRLDSDPSTMERFLSGSKGKDTISGAFIWGNTEEGGKFWNNVDKEFQNWYRGEVPFNQVSVGEEFYLDKVKCKKLSPKTFVLTKDIICCPPEKLVTLTKEE
jgi:hypothetical protein